MKIAASSEVMLSVFLVSAFLVFTTLDSTFIESPILAEKESKIIFSSLKTYICNSMGLSSVFKNSCKSSVFANNSFISELTDKFTFGFLGSG